MIRVLSCSAFLMLLASLSTFAQDASSCARPELANQKKDSETISRLERAWSLAYMKGDAEFEQCLLLPGYQEIKSSGKLEVLSDELAKAAKNKGKNLPIPELTPPTVLIHDDVAVAHGTYSFTDASGQKREIHSADYYHWENGGWRVFFAQQSLVPAGS